MKFCTILTTLLFSFFTANSAQTNESQKMEVSSSHEEEDIVKAVECFTQGMFLAENGDAKSAIKAFEMAIKHKPDFIEG